MEALTSYTVTILLLPRPHKGPPLLAGFQIAHVIQCGLERPRSQGGPKVSGIPSSSPRAHDI